MTQAFSGLMSVAGEGNRPMKKMFSAIQPTGKIHLGNYLGAIRTWVSIQSEYDSIFCVADLHALTTIRDPEILRSKTVEAAAILVEAGIVAPSRLFVQSHIGAHAELAWVLQCITPVGWLRRMTQFKDKMDSSESVGSGVFAYPTLMAADILLYSTDAVPVGEDQLQHLEITRDIAKRFNSVYGDTFVLPEAVVSETAGRIMALNEPKKKMSKSGTNSWDAVYLLDSPDEIVAKIGRATTDSQREIRFDESRPGIFNLLVIYEMLSGDSQSSVESHFEGKGYAQFKRELSEIIVETLVPIQRRYHELMTAPDEIGTVLRKGEESVRPAAESMMRTVSERVGIK